MMKKEEHTHFWEHYHFPRLKLGLTSPPRKTPQIPKNKATYFRRWPILSDLGGARTLGPLIKSQLLYQLSYEVILLLHTRQIGFAGANMQQYF